MTFRLYKTSLALLWVSACAHCLWAQVSIREEKMMIPTWEIDPPAVHSLFPNPQGPIYPYTLNEILTDRKIDREYQGVILENEYIKVLVLPEIGGRLHGALDKSNSYVWLYWQKTIKPGLISMTGAWISGGIEWNFPHGHRPSGFMPVDHRIVQNPDGSGTVWVGETEPVYRMRWLVGLTIFPGKSYLRCDYIFINPTNHRQPFQFWATAATHANEWSQAQYPGDMVTGHGKHEFWSWPVHNGVDLTWWKNVPNASSFFAFNNPSNWFGTYDHRAQGGLVHVADHRTLPGKKLWTWGSGPSGRIWEDILTEGGGPYFEPQAGAWSDNQPDYHWMWPNEVKTTHDYWYPVRDTRGYHNANEDFAINTDLQKGMAFGAVYATGVARDHRVVMKNTKANSVLFDVTAVIAPDKPFTREVNVPADITIYDLQLAVYDAKGNLQIELQQKPPRKVELPPGQRDPGDPKKMDSNELYRAAEWLDRFVRTEEALVYYREALKRDAKDPRAHTDLGFLSLKQGKWEGALKHFATALERDYDNSRIYFGKGLAYSGLQNYREAYDQFYRATYTYDYASAANLNLARISLRWKDYTGAIARAEAAAAQNNKFADIHALAAAAYRHLGDDHNAFAAAGRALEADPMHFMGGFEKTLALRNRGDSSDPWPATWQSIMRGATQNYLELAAAYADAGLFAEADDVLRLNSEGKGDEALYPMVNYLRGYFKELLGDLPGAGLFYDKAAKGPVAHTNPHRLEEKAALEAALRKNPLDAHAHLFLGNLLYAMGQREEGSQHWQKAIECQDSLSLAWRNVAYAENHLKKNLAASYKAYQKTLKLDPNDARALLELDQVAEQLKVPPAERLAYLVKNLQTASSRDDLIARLIDLRLQAGDEKNLQLAYDVLKHRHFHSWEGGYGIHDAWVEVNQRLGDRAYEAKSYAVALERYQEAGEYPKNLEVAARTPDFRAHVNWNLAKANLALGRNAAAQEQLRSILAERYRKPHIGTYYQALAQKALKNNAGYRTLLDGLEKQAREYTSDKYEYRGDPGTIGHVLLSLVLQERAEKAGAEAELRKALESNPRAMRLAIREAQLDIAQAHQ